jgi:hypothetical protein
MRSAGGVILPILLVLLGSILAALTLGIFVAVGKLSRIVVILTDIRAILTERTHK